MVHPLAFPLKSTFERVNGDLEALIKASWVTMTLETGSTKDRSKEVKERFGVNDTVGDVDAAVEGDVKSAGPTTKPDNKTPERKSAAHKGAGLGLSTVIRPKCFIASALIQRREKISR